MDVAGLSMNMTAVSLQGKVSTAVLGKTMDDAEAMGAGLVRMIDAAAMERSVNPHIGGNFDVSI